MVVDKQFLLKGFLCSFSPFDHNKDNFVKLFELVHRAYFVLVVLAPNTSTVHLLPTVYNLGSAIYGFAYFT